MEEKQICPVCGEEFFRKTSKKIYCSGICARKAHYLKQKERRNKVEAICPGCGKKFQRSGNGRCCSERCENIFRGKEEKICGFCGKKFFPTKENKAFCSEDCRKKKNYYKPKNPEKTKKTSISEIVKAAMARGMSYGKYVEALEKGIL